MVYGENEIVINIGFELANITIEMIESDNEQHYGLTVEALKKQLRTTSRG